MPITKVAKIMKKHKYEVSDEEIGIIIQMISWGQLEIRRQMKNLGRCDYDIKEYFWYYRERSNRIKDKLKEIRGY